MPHIIQRRHLAAAIHTAGVKDLRSYLNGVRVEGRIMVATDGVCLSAYLGPECGEYLPPFTIPLEVVKRVVKRKTEKLEVRDAKDGWLQIGDEMFRPLDGRFPDYRRVLLPAKEAEPGGVTVDPEQMVKFSKIRATLGVAWVPRLYATGTGNRQPLRVALGGHEAEFMGVIMPAVFTGKEGAPVCGEWLK